MNKRILATVLLFSAHFAGPLVAIQSLQKPMNPTPTLTDFNGYYNVDPVAVGDSNTANYLCLKPGLQRPALDELYEVIDLFEAYARSEGIPVDKLYCGPQADDRSIFLDFMRLDDFSIRRLKDLQSILNKGPPDWRVVIFGPTPETTVCIYPSRIVYAMPGDEATVLQKIMDARSAEDDLKRGAERRQVQWVRHLLLNGKFSIAELRSGPRVIAVFGNSRGDESKCTFWISSNGTGCRGSVGWYPEAIDGIPWYSGTKFFLVEGSFDLVEARDPRAFDHYGRVFEVSREKDSFPDRIRLIPESYANGPTNGPSRVEGIDLIEFDISGIPVLSDAELKLKLREIKDMGPKKSELPNAGEGLLDDKSGG